MQASPSLPDPLKSHKLPKIFFRVISHYRVINATADESHSETQDFIVEAQDAKEAALLAIAKLEGPFVANLQMTIAISHTAEGAE